MVTATFDTYFETYRRTSDENISWKFVAGHFFPAVVIDFRYEEKSIPIRIIIYDTDKYKEKKQKYANLIFFVVQKKNKKCIEESDNNIYGSWKRAYKQYSVP